MYKRIRDVYSGSPFRDTEKMSSTTIADEVDIIIVGGKTPLLFRKGVNCDV